MLINVFKRRAFMYKHFLRFSCVFSLLAIIVSGCATPLPPTYVTSDSGRVLEGPVLAIEGEGDLVVAVNHDGLFMKSGDGPWINQEVPGLSKFSRVTCLAVDEGVVYLGSDGEGLHILSEGTWEIKTSRYGGLPDDGVLSIAIDGSDEGLPGTALWVGTRKGVAAYREGKWVVYKPDGDWLVAMTGKSGSGAGKVYVGSGFKLGRKGDDSKRFHPPVSVIGVGADRVVFGNRNSSLAVVSESGAAILRFHEEQTFSHLTINGGVVWAGTDAGLLWGGLKDHAEGKPWPTTGGYLGWSGTLLGSRDTRGFEYRWKFVGYNAARITGLEKRGADLWVAHRAKGGGYRNLDLSRSFGTEEITLDPITDIRRFMDVDEYVARRQKMQHESYGADEGIRGEPTALYVTSDHRRVWIGTTKGLWELEQY
jgi:hypothetical protein